MVSKFRPRVTILDNLGKEIYTFEFLSLSKAKKSLVDNRYIKYKKVVDEVTTNKTVILENKEKLDLNKYVNLVNKKNKPVNDIPKPKMKYIYKSLDSRKYKAILEF